jgi:hypothetical protein
VGATNPFSTRLLYLSHTPCPLWVDCPAPSSYLTLHKLSNPKGIHLFLQPETDSQVSPTAPEMDPGHDAGIHFQVVVMPFWRACNQ